MSSIMASYPVSSLPLEKFSKLHSGPALEKLSDKIRVPLHAVKSSLEGRVVAALTAAAITLSILSCYFKLSRPGKETPSSRLLSSNDEYSACEMVCPVTHPHPPNFRSRFSLIQWFWKRAFDTENLSIYLDLTRYCKLTVVYELSSV